MRASPSSRRSRGVPSSGGLAALLFALLASACCLSVDLGALSPSAEPTAEEAPAIRGTVPQIAPEAPAAPAPPTSAPAPRHDIAADVPVARPSVSASSLLPPEAQPVLDAIARGGPYRYRQDGTTFQNREQLLPSRPRGFYREFTVETPGSRDRGARRIVTGGDPPTEFYYTDDHYRSFRRFEPPGGH